MSCENVFIGILRSDGFIRIESCPKTKSAELMLQLKDQPGVEMVSSDESETLAGAILNLILGLRINNIQFI